MLKSKLVCPVCGYPDLDEPPYDSHGSPNFGICPCCGVEFGNDDWERPHSALRDDWAKKKYAWFSQYTLPPPGWDPIAQFKAAGLWSPLLPQDQE